MESPADGIAREILEVVPLIMRTIRTEMRSRQSADLSVVQFRTLMFLNRNPGASLSTVAGHLGLTLPTVSKMIDRMVVDGVVTRSDSTSDRRRMTLVLTTQGRGLLEKAHRGTELRLTEILAGLTPRECTIVHQALLALQPVFSPTVTHLLDPSR